MLQSAFHPANPCKWWYDNPPLWPGWRIKRPFSTPKPPPKKRTFFAQWSSRLFRAADIFNRGSWISVSPSVRLSIHPSVGPKVRPSVHPSTWLTQPYPRFFFLRWKNRFVRLLAFAGLNVWWCIITRRTDGWMDEASSRLQIPYHRWGINWRHSTLGGHMHAYMQRTKAYISHPGDTYFYAVLQLQ